MAFLSRIDLQKISEMRIKEAILLLQNGYFSGAYYIAGYSVEIGLKGCISRTFDNDVLPDKNFVKNIYSHDLPTLVGLASLKDSLDELRKKNDAFNVHWALVSQWRAESRYEFIEDFRAQALIGAIIDKKAGIGPWIAQHW